MPDNKDVFGLEAQIGGSWSLDGAVLSMTDAENLVVTSINLNYVRRSQKFSPLNQNKKYMACGEADGMLDLGIIIGPNRDIIAFLKKYADACQLKNNTLKIEPVGVGKACGNNEEIYFICTGCLINTLRLGVNQIGGSMTVVSAGIIMSFISLKVGPSA